MAAADRRIAPRRREAWFAITGARRSPYVAKALVVLAACGAPATNWPSKRAAPGAYHDPDHARGDLPSAATRKAELATIRTSLDTMYAHRKAKLARYSIDEDALFAETETRLLAATTWAAYDVALYNALARFHDGHLTYHPPQTAAPSRGYDSYRLGLHTVFARDHFLVESVDPGSDVATAGVMPGDDVTAIDDRPLSAILEASADRTTSRPESAHTSFAKSWTSVLYPKGDKPRSRSIGVHRRDGTDVHVAITPKLAVKQKHEAVSMTQVGDVAVVTIRSLQGGGKRIAEIEGALAKARAAPALVIDMRGDLGGIDKIGKAVVAGLAEGAAPWAQYRVLVAPETIARRPLWKALAGTGDADGFSPLQNETVKGLDHGYRGKVAVVIDAACVSTCEVVTGALRADLHAKVVGATTGGSSGAPVAVVLPATHGSINIPTWNLLSAEGKPIEDDGVVPDLEVYPTSDALAAGQDLPLQQAIDLVK